MLTTVAFIPPLFAPMIFWTAVIGVFFAPTFSRYIGWRLLPKRLIEDMLQTSVLLAHYTEDQQLECMIAEKYKGNYYTLLMTKPKGTLIYRLELPFNTEAHILGISNSYQGLNTKVQRYIQSQSMEQVVLEGDFRDHFTLYAARGQQAQVRYVFDPKAMAYAIDYCNTHSWEIVGDELYFVAQANHTGGNVNWLDGSYRFLEEIRPALVRRLPGHAKPYRSPYGVYRGKPLKCPLCSAELLNMKHWQECPDQHGRLISGKQLLAVRHGKVKVEGLPPSAALDHARIRCPHCKHRMVPTDYQNTSIIIDSCGNCHFRWLDAGELKRVAL